MTVDQWRTILRSFKISDIRYYGVELPPTREYILKKILTLKLHHIFKPHEILIEVVR